PWPLRSTRRERPVLLELPDNFRHLVFRRKFFKLNLFLPDLLVGGQDVQFGQLRKLVFQPLMSVLKCPELTMLPAYDYQDGRVFTQHNVPSFLQHHDHSILMRMLVVSSAKALALETETLIQPLCRDVGGTDLEQGRLRPFRGRDRQSLPHQLLSDPPPPQLRANHQVHQMQFFKHDPKHTITYQNPFGHFVPLLILSSGREIRREYVISQFTEKHLSRPWFGKRALLERDHLLKIAFLHRHQLHFDFLIPPARPARRDGRFSQFTGWPSEVAPGAILPALFPSSSRPQHGEDT